MVRPGELRLHQIEPTVVLIDQSSYFPLEKRSGGEGVNDLMSVCDVMGAPHRVVRDGDNLEHAFSGRGVTV